MADKIHNVAEFIKCVRKEVKPGLNLYRGQSNADWDLIPSIFRDEFNGNEYNVICAMEQENPEHFGYEKSMFEKLVLLQHFGIPTRLLDWSKSPLVGLYFATDACQENDGSVYIINRQSQYPGNHLHVEILSNLNKIIPFSEKTINQYCSILESTSRISESHIFATEELIKSILLVSPPIINNRLRVQQSMFTLHGSPIENSNGKDRINTNECSKIKDNLLSKIIIPFKAKENIRAELAVLGYTENFLFPGLESTAKDIVRRIRKR